MAVGVAALAMAGCGGDDGPTKEEFAKNADKVCADLQKQTESIEANPQTPKEVEEFAAELRTTAESASKKVKELELPGGDAEAKAKEWQDAVAKQSEQRLIPALDKLESAAKEKDAQGMVSAAQEIQKLSEETEAKDLAKELGMKDCAT
jgi:molecular chaperone GrpE (heat shock protein)